MTHSVKFVAVNAKSRRPYTSSTPKGSTIEQIDGNSDWLPSGYKNPEKTWVKTPGTMFLGENPAVSARAFKSAIRRFCATDLAFEKIAKDTGVPVEDVKVSWKALFRNAAGGLLAGEKIEEAAFRLHSRQINPVVGLFGAAAPIFIPGRFLPGYLQAHPGGTLMADVVVRHDISGTELAATRLTAEELALALEEKDRIKQAKAQAEQDAQDGSTSEVRKVDQVENQMITQARFCIPAETQFEQTSHVASATPAELGLLILAHQRFRQSPFLGAGRASGYGGDFEIDWRIVEIDFQTGEERDLGTVSELSEITRGWVQAWHDCEFDYETPEYANVKLIGKTGRAGKATGKKTPKSDAKTLTPIAQ